MQVPSILARVVLDVSGRGRDLAARVVHPVGADGVPARDVAVGPCGRGEERDGEAAGGERGGGEDEERGGDGHPDRAGQQRQRAQHHQRHHRARHRQTRQKQQHRAGDQKRHEPHHLRRVRRVGLHAAKQRRRLIAAAEQPVVPIRHDRLAL
ncbi:hypothetical protein QOZ80_5BG0410390 [Eleusine coracana subsp. coracana]|nr:hypothetical protein QOZ80_5BG0410390 [Eleusine coracana subsp. coracana]